MIIKSVTNNKVQLLKKLAMRKYRKEYNLFVVEGENIIKDIPPQISIHSLYVKESKQQVFAKYIAEATCPVYLLADHCFDSVSDTVTPQGILAVLPYCTNEDLTVIKSRAIVLDGVADSGNLGTIIRTAIAFGYRDVVLINTADPYSGKSVRSSMGAVLKARIYETDYEKIEEHIFETYILDMKGEDIDSVQTISNKHMLVVGSEAHGVSEFFRKRANISLAIKMDKGSESLNAAVSAAIGMYVLSQKLS